MKSIFQVFFSILILSGNSLFAQKFNDRFGSVSPDRQSIMFESNRVRPVNIFIANLDGTELKQITRKGVNTVPSWSRDSQSIVFSVLDGDNYDVFTLNLVNEKQTRITSDSALDLAPVWQGEWIYYSSNRNNENQLRRVNTSTGHDELINNDIEHHNGISFSPDHKLASVVTKNENNNWDIALIDLSKKTIVKEFNHPARDGGAKWSPLGDQIIFQSNRDGQWDVFIMDMDGSGVTNLTKGKGNSRFASWFPDGSKIIFSSDRGENGYRLFTMNMDGSEQKEIKITGN